VTDGTLFLRGAWAGGATRGGAVPYDRNPIKTRTQDINSIYNVLELLQSRARSTEALVMVKLDIARNRILTAGLVFSMASTCLTVGALVSGIFGEPASLAV